MWAQLLAHEAATRDRRIADLCDDVRAADFSIRAGDMLFDYAKTSIDATAREMLIGLLDARGVAQKREAMFAGEKINTTEGRAVLHTALRNLDGGPVLVDGRDVMPEVRATLMRMERFASDVRSGRFRLGGGAVQDVINIGIGGSDLGPAMAVRALSPWADGPQAMRGTVTDAGRMT